MRVCSSFGAQLVGVLGADAFATWQVGAMCCGKRAYPPWSLEAIPKGDFIFQSTSAGYAKLPGHISCFNLPRCDIWTRNLPWSKAVAVPSKQIGVRQEYRLMKNSHMMVVKENKPHLGRWCNLTSVLQGWNRQLIRWRVHGQIRQSPLEIVTLKN